MKARVFTAAMAAIALIAITVPAFAHHSFSAEFDANRRVTLTGVITNVKWQNPHVYFYVDVKENGKVVNYAVELGSPNGVLGNGLSRNALKVGQVVSLNGSMAKDGTAKVNGSNITIDGKPYNAASSEGTTP
jgi:hypothetical protein